MSFPPASAGPSAVRAYLTDLLISKHDTTPDFAQEVASHWRLGRPNDLRDASARYFRTIFGDDVGPFLYRTVQEDIKEQWNSSPAGVRNFWIMVLSLVISILFLARAVRGNSSHTMAASLFYAGLSFGPPMVYCGVQDQYSPWQFARTFIGSIVSLLTFAAAFVNFLDRYAVKQKREGEDKTQSVVGKKNK